MRSAQDGASASNEGREVRDQAEACGTASGRTQAVDARSCSKPECRTFHKAGERVDVLIAQFLVTKVAGQALVRCANTSGGRLSLHEDEDVSSMSYSIFQSKGPGEGKEHSGNI